MDQVRLLVFDYYFIRFDVSKTHQYSSLNMPIGREGKCRFGGFNERANAIYYARDTGATAGWHV